MSFKSYNGVIRRLGRGVVLPVGRIKAVVEQEVFSEVRHPVKLCVDFGAGTRFWSDWLRTKCGCTFAVDVIYDSFQERNGVICVKTLQEAEERFPDSGMEGKLFWASDVFHHLNQELIRGLLENATQSYEWIIIKDINCHKKFGNMMNRLHDRFLNHEEVIDIDPEAISRDLESKGFAVRFYEMRRLWYPHFLIVARKAGLSPEAR